MREGENNNLFQVNLKGMIALLSEHIYSNPNTFVRELLQNCTDAITALRNIDEEYAGRIDVFLREDGSMVFQDNGIGLKEEEVYRFLTIIGESSKRETPDANDFIGRFGIGLLSCFVVTNEITVESRSAMGKQPVRWCGKVDGTYQTTLPEEEWPIGSRVILVPKKEWTHLFEYETFKKILRNYGQILPYSIYLHHQDEEELVNTPSPVWLDSKATRNELLEHGKKVFQSSALDAFRIHTENGKVNGVFYILPFRTQFSTGNSHKVYLKRMLLSENDCNLLPSWAFFIRCLVNADGLVSTASRESFVNNDLLKDTRKEIGVAIKEYLKRLVENDRETFNRILDVHFFHIKAIASEDNELLRLFIDYLPFETSKGTRSFGNIRSTESTIRYTRNLEDFRQVRRIAGAQGWMIVNAAYTFDESLLKKASLLFPELTLEAVSPARILEQFTEVVATEEHKTFEKQASELLKSFGCICRLKHFTPVDTPVIFVAEEKETQTKAANNPLLGVLGSITTQKQIPPTLTFNADNEMIQMLLRIKSDNKLFKHIVHILYVQALMQGRYPVNNEEMNLFNRSLCELMSAKMNDFINFLN
ncbi:HSP90 family protein [Oscillospiraceae bacterium N12]|jgi:molecular chaperone HtpG|uniref:HSP90 family protein n=1 Tax=Jilunia laotingensis TaxID=2763675 RepID=A0A926F506_9BACT|nr:HSP90 family protein [Jilunia laotingensis]MBC8592024.1 HSP90 family protein [Jilunia laotingensis]